MKKVLALISDDAKNVPFASNLTGVEGILHLMVEHTEALSGHHLAARFLEENAVKHNRYLSILNFQKGSCNSSSIFLS